VPSTPSWDDTITALVITSVFPHLLTANAVDQFLEERIVSFPASSKDWIGSLRPRNVILVSQAGDIPLALPFEQQPPELRAAIKEAKKTLPPPPPISMPAPTPNGVSSDLNRREFWMGKLIELYIPDLVKRGIFRFSYTEVASWVNYYMQSHPSMFNERDYEEMVGGGHRRTMRWRSDLTRALKFLTKAGYVTRDGKKTQQYLIPQI
jgi:hypothetical protein